jgi:hypothetical protein
MSRVGLVNRTAEAANQKGISRGSLVLELPVIGKSEVVKYLLDSREK